MTLGERRSSTVSRTRLRVGLSFLALALLLLALIGVVAGHAARQAGERASRELLQQIASSVARQLDSDLAASQREVLQLADIEAALGVEMDAARWAPVIERMARSHPYYSWVGVTDAQGVVLASSGGLLVGRDVSQRPWFQRGRERPVVVDVHEAALLGSMLPPSRSGEPQRFVDLAAPLRRDGRVVGVLAVHLNWDWADDRRQEALAQFAPAQRLQIVLVDREGRPVLGLPAGARSDEAGLLSASEASRASGDYPGMGLAVLARQPEETALAPARALERRIWWFAALAAVLFGAFGWWLAGWLTLPLRRVAEHARAQAPAAGGGVLADEVQDLAASLAALIDGLRAREASLAGMNAQLEDMVRERTAALLQANEDLRSFTRSVSHDLRGPLGQMALLMRRTLADAEPPPSAPMRRRLVAVADECERLRRLVEALLELAVAQQRELSPRVVDSLALVQAVLEEQAASWAGPLPAVHVGPLPEVRGDAVLLRQVWSNLLSNAWKYSAQAEAPQIRIESVAEGGRIRFTVADNGAGFDAAKATRLFEAFERLPGHEAYAGAGVGLSIVQRVVQRHGGRVWAESRPGQGAQFHFTLPAAAEPPGEAPPASRPAELAA